MQWKLNQQDKKAIFIGMAIACFGLLAFGLYLQHAVGLVPCPMCIVQRYLLVLVGVFCLFAGFARGSLGMTLAGSLSSIAALLGAGVAARQSWLQWYPPEVVSCGRDLFGMIESFPIQRVLPMVFKGSGDCSKVDWTFLGRSIANWSFVCFLFLSMGSACLVVLGRRESTNA